MTLYELTRLADEIDEDAFDIADFTLAELDEIMREDFTVNDFKKKYLAFYDDIKTSPRDDW